MRIITGSMRGIRLNSPASSQIRPTTDKVKEAIFSMVNVYPEDGVILDVFAGTGNLGLEALSRGARICYFGDNRAESIKLIKTNIELCNAKERSVVIMGGFEKFLAQIPEKADLIFLDPPYKNGLMNACFQKLRELELLKEDGIVVAEHGTFEVLPDIFFGFNKIKEKKYGTILISLYGKAVEI